jgi:hypothetical protein
MSANACHHNSQPIGYFVLSASFSVKKLEIKCFRMKLHRDKQGFFALHESFVICSACNNQRLLLIA